MFKAVITFMTVAILVGAFYKYKTTPRFYRVDFSTVSQENTKPIDACRAKKTCVIAYVAPWCGACHQFVAQLPTIRPRLAAKDVGLVFVVGAEVDQAKKEEFLTRLDPEAVLDSPGDEFRRRHEVSFFPSFIVIDGGGSVIADPKQGRKKVIELIN